MNRFLCDDPLTPESREIVLSSEESHHLARVMRMREGEALLLIDGVGGLAEGVVVDSSPKKSRVEITKLHPSTGIVGKVHVCFGIPKAAALDFIIRRCTELGVASFQPLETQHSLHVKDWNNERWSKIVSEVCKQCEERVFPKIHSPMSLKDWFSTRDKSRDVFLCDENQRESDSVAPKGDVYLLIGAEGGWSKEEISSIREIGARSFGLGKNRLRAETAAVVATVLAKKIVGEML